MAAATKENLPVRRPIASAATNIDIGDGNERGGEEEEDYPCMLSPPPEEELRLKRMNEPGSASKPLAASGRPNQQQHERENAQSPTSELKRKRALRSIETPPRPTRGSHEQDQLRRGEHARRDINEHGHDHEHQTQNTVHQTPNPRVRKQVRHAELSPTVGIFADGSPPPRLNFAARSGLDSGARSGSGPGVGSESPSRLGCSSSSARKSLLQEDKDTGLMSPTRKSKGKGRTMDLLTAVHSPHATNPSADYIPVSSLAVKQDGKVSVRRRSITPIPPYEPPAERFTPPREIMSTPMHAEKKKPVRRVTKKRTETKVPLPTRIKTEPPEIDLTAPAPPASPSEDPILLIGSPTSLRARRASNLSMEDGKPKDLVDFEMELDLPADESRNNSRIVEAGPSAMSTPRVDSSMTGPVPSAFDFSNLEDDDFGTNDFVTGPADDNWVDDDSDEDDDDEVMEGEGDYTGKFLSFKMPLKMDPPTSATRHRMEEWGRPISPHPKKFSFSEDDEDGEDEGDGDVGEKEIFGNNNENRHEEDELREKIDSVSAGNPEADQSAPQMEKQDEAEKRANDGDDDDSGRPAYQDRRGRRLTLSELEARKFGSSKDDDPEGSPVTNLDRKAQEQEEEQADLDEFDPEENDDDLIEQSMDVEDGPGDEPELEAPEMIGAESVQSGAQEQVDVGDNRSDTIELHELESSGRHATALSQTETLVGHLETEQSFSRSVFNRDRYSAPFDSTPARDEEGSTSTRDDQTAVGENAYQPNQEHAEQEGGSDSDSEEVTDLGVVKIVSNDPMAAARAAAILKLHDYDMIARRLRRKSMAGGGVRKAYGTPKKADLWRRRTIAGLAAEDCLSANITLPELLERAEEELRSTPARSRAGSVSVPGTPKEAVRESIARQEDTWGPREWTKTDWKSLDSCFTDERYQLAKDRGFPSGVLASVEDVESQSVVDRFIEMIGGSALTDSHGPSWSIEKLLQRVDALRKRQRNGHGAPPTPILTSRHNFINSPSSSMIVPEFTPTPAERIRRFKYPGLDIGTATLTPNFPDRMFKAPLPPSLTGSGTSSLNEAFARIANGPQDVDDSSVAGFSTPSRAGTPESHVSNDGLSELPEMSKILSTPLTNRVQQQQQTPMSAVKRSLNYINSWLRPGMFKPKEQQRASSLPGLPVPPADVLGKPRGPVATPSKKPAPKPMHPKEQVMLQPAPAPQPPSRIPRVTKRLVDLQHVPTPPPKPLVAKAISRRSSGSSVKDLVKEFEEIEQSKVKPLPPRVAELRRMGSLDTLKNKQGQKPTWRP